MCGIAGLFCPAGVREDLAGSVLGRMTGAVAHRGPDDHGAWIDPVAGIALGHRRLSIVDLSVLGHQPMQSTCDRYVLTYNGEIYNFKTLARELADLGHHFRGHSDTEVLLAAVSHWGLERALQRFNGMFAFALWDKQARTLHLVRDRVGEKPLYYGWTGETLLFGSELKVLRAHPEFRSAIDRDALALYLRHGYVPAPHSIYRGIRKLPAGHVLSLVHGSPVRSAVPVAYWSAREVAERGAQDPFRGSVRDAEEQLDALLRDAVACRMEADVPLGAFLSGGIDSSLVVALMQAQSARPVRTFTIGFRESEYNEAHYARLVAAHLGTAHTELYVTPEEALGVIPRLPTLYDEPFADSSQIPTFLVSELTRRSVTVSLSGDGGDEVFGGYRRYLNAEKVWRAIGWIHPRFRAAAARGIAGSAAGLEWAFASERQDHVRRLAGRMRSLGQILSAEGMETLYLRAMSQWKEPASILRAGSEPPTALVDAEQWAKLRERIHRMMYLDTVTYLPDDILVKVDRASMGASLEARVPLLDPRVIEFAWRLPIAMKIRAGKGKWILRQVLARYLRPELIERPKMGFGVPIDRWLRGPLRDWAEELLGERRLAEQGFFDPAPIRATWQQHASGAAQWHHHLWAVLMFQAWLDENAAGPSVSASPYQRQTCDV